jgi:ribonuclease HII
MKELSMYQYETRYFDKGYTLIAGTDEVGRGPLAGPVVASAVILDPLSLIEGLNDSKQLSIKKRNVLYDQIMTHAKAVNTIFLGPKVIDEINIYQASKKAMIDAINSLEITPEVVLSDAMPLRIEGMINEAIIKGDTLSASIAAASIVAKVERDRYMVRMSKNYPKYGFEKHKGYPTKQHLKALKEFGPCPIHRTSYAPVRDVINQQVSLFD